jgi:macrolide-specific efflux system membrane fusion protein
VVATATVGTQRKTVSASGTIEPAEQADLNFSVSGEVTEVLVKEGDQVTAGQTLATVDDTLLQAQLTAAQAQLDAAEDKAASADADAAASADAAVIAAESDVTAAQEAVDNASLTSTIDGTVVTVSLKAGDRVTTGGGNGGGDDTESTQFTVVSTNRFVVDVKVGADDVDQVKQGMAVAVTPTGGSEPVDGTVRTVGLVASADESGVATFPVTIDVTGEQENIYAGSSATASIVVEERADVLTVPAMALHTEGSTTYVNKVAGGRTTRTDVKVGDTFGAQTEIVSGLAEGDQVEVTVAGPVTGGSGGQNGRTGVFPGGGDEVMPGGGGGPGGFQNGGGR